MNRFLTIAFETLCALAVFFTVVSLFLPMPELTLRGAAFEQHLLLLFGMLAALVLWFAAGVVSGKAEIPRTPLDAPMVLFLVALGASAFAGTDVWRSVLGTWEEPARSVPAFAGYIVLFFFVFHLIRTKRSLWIAIAIFWGVFLGSMAMVQQIVFPDSFRGVGEFSFEDSQALSISLLFFAGLVFLAGRTATMLAKRRTRFPGMLMGVFLLFLFLVLFVVAYRFPDVSWVWIFSIVSAWLFFSLTAATFRDSRKTGFFMAVFLVSIAAYFLGGALSDRSIADTQEMSLETASSVAVSSLRGNFFFGHGAGLYEYAFSMHRPLDLNQGAALFENSFPQPGLLLAFPATIGVLGTAALLFLVLSFIGFGFFSGYGGKGVGIFSWIGTVIPASVLLVAVLFFSVSGSVLAFFFLLMAVSVAASRDPEQLAKHVRTISFRPRPEYALSAGFVATIFLAVWGYSILFLFSSVQAQALAKAAMEKEDPEEAIDLLKRAESNNLREGWYALFLGERFVELVEKEPANAEDEKALKRMEETMNTASERLAKAKRKLPGSARAAERIGGAYERLGVYVPDFYQETQKYYAEAAELEPHNPRLHFKRGEVFVQQAIHLAKEGEKQTFLSQAKESFETALSKKHEFPQAWYMLALTQEGLGELEGAMASCEQALAFFPADANVKRLLARLHTARGGEGDREKAIALHGEILKRDPEDVNAAFALGKIFAETDKGQSAEYFDQALEHTQDEALRASIEEAKDALFQPEPDIEAEEASEGERDTDSGGEEEGEEGDREEEDKESGENEEADGEEGGEENTENEEREREDEDDDDEDEDEEDE